MCRVLVVIMFLVTLSPGASVRAGAQTINDPHGQWSIVLADVYQPTQSLYEVKNEQHQGFLAASSYEALAHPTVTIWYSECCAPDPNILAQVTAGAFDKQKQATPDAQMDPAGIQPAALGGQPALRFDYFSTSQGVRYHTQETTALVSGLLYVLTFALPDTGFDAARDEMKAITDSFRFITRSIIAGIYSDPMGRFTFSVPSGYDLVPNSFDALSDYQLSLSSLSPSQAADSNTAPVIIVDSNSDDLTFEDRLDVYANVGAPGIIKRGGEIGPDAVRRITLDGRPAGFMEFYLPTRAGVRVHVYQAFTVLNGTQYLIAFNFLPEDQSATQTVDALLSSFHFLSV